MAADNAAAFEKANEQYVASFNEGGLPLPPARKALVLACMDARLDPAKALGLQIGDVHVVRNAGGRASADALRSIAISQRLLGTTEVHVVHHTDCGMVTFQDADIRAKLRSDLGDAAGDAADSIDFLPFSDLEQSVRDDLAAIKAAAIVAPETAVHGFVYDVHTGKISPVQP